MDECCTAAAAQRRETRFQRDRCRCELGPPARAAGERPDAFNPSSEPWFQTIAKRSEPSPLETGSTTASVIAVATAASTALPPAFITSTAASVDGSVEVAAIACVA